jgi:hypothetical protein
MNDLTQIDPLTHILSPVMVIGFALFVAAVVYAAIFFKKDPPETELRREPDPGEIDAIHYPDTGEDLYR